MLVAPLIIKSFSWEYVFLIFGAVGFVWLAGWAPQRIRAQQAANARFAATRAIELPPVTGEALRGESGGSGSWEWHRASNSKGCGGRHLWRPGRGQSQERRDAGYGMFHSTSCELQPRYSVAARDRRTFSKLWESAVVCPGLFTRGLHTSANLSFGTLLKMHRYLYHQQMFQAWNTPKKFIPVVAVYAVVLWYHGNMFSAPETVLLHVSSSCSDYLNWRHRPALDASNLFVPRFEVQIRFRDVQQLRHSYAMLWQSSDVLFGS